MLIRETSHSGNEPPLPAAWRKCGGAKLDNVHDRLAEASLFSHSSAGDQSFSSATSFLVVARSPDRATPREKFVAGTVLAATRRAESVVAELARPTAKPAGVVRRGSLASAFSGRLAFVFLEEFDALPNRRRHMGVVVARYAHRLDVQPLLPRRFRRAPATAVGPGLLAAVVDPQRAAESGRKCLGRAHDELTPIRPVEDHLFVVLALDPFGLVGRARERSRGAEAVAG